MPNQRGLLQPASTVGHSGPALPHIASSRSRSRRSSCGSHLLCHRRAFQRRLTGSAGSTAAGTHRRRADDAPSGDAPVTTGVQPRRAHHGGESRGHGPARRGAAPGGATQRRLVHVLLRKALRANDRVVLLLQISTASIVVSLFIVCSMRTAAGRIEFIVQIKKECHVECIT